LSAELVARLGWWWYFDDALREGETWTAQVLARVEAAPAALPAALAARCAITGARLAFYSGAIAVAQQRSAQALEWARAAGDVEAEAHALLIRALAINPVSRADADATMAACLDAFHAVGEPWGLALATQYRGVLLYFHPDATAACERFLNEGRARFEALGDLWGSGATAAYLGMIAMARGDTDMAERHAQLNLEIARSTGDRFREAAGLHMLARVALARGDLGAAIEGARENVALQVSRGSRASACDAGRWLAFLQWRHGQPESAARLLGASGEPGPPTPFSLLLGPERLADIAEVQRALPLALGDERRAELAAEGAALGLERLLGLVGGRDG
jgi:tetratricopeptide (TPR) repeat protein